MQEEMFESTEETPAVEMSAEDLGALFASEVEPERVEVPGHPGCAVYLLPMGPRAYDAYMESGQTIRMKDGNITQGEVSLRLAQQNEDLLAETVVGYELLFPKRAQDGGMTQVMRRAPAKAEERKREIRSLYRDSQHGFRRPFAEWLIRQCKRVNGLEEIHLGNALSPAGGPR